MAKPYVRNIKTQIIIDMKEDISSAEFVKLFVKKGNNVEIEWVCSVYQTDYLLHQVEEGDFDIPGIYKIQPYIEMPEWEGRCNTVEFTVYANYQ